ncbi:PepSY-like domain-containing protein [Dyadobacter sandarakinus]|uniref:PepSY-like domain-containing protein n=1 Tax=Dyadobacter sandarakinus TaxID=2747268 RepID=A0ABX7I3S2_9BACT|nr:PepSY-like domain-containing protein [Dyadobacter sandarakinus]QRQ99690.1 PepSY-like domain-containing protein [Dyadobacter sandarakinus]
MKNASVCLMLLLGIMTACDNEKVVDEATLPARAKEYVEAHFPNAAISQVVRDRDDLSVSWDVTLNNQFELEFDKAGDCYSVEAHQSEPLPDSVIPLKILEYTAENYPKAFITSWEKDKTDQEIKLSDQTELVFNLSGTFLRMDQ